MRTIHSLAIARTFAGPILVSLVVNLSLPDSLRAAPQAELRQATKHPQPGQVVRFAAIKGKDNRRPISKANKAIGTSIGFVIFPDRTGCTAFCVGRDLAMTAAHCFIDPKKKKLRSSVKGAVFKLPLLPIARGRIYSRIKANNAAKFGAAVVLGRRSLPTDASDFETDWALMKLAAPICLDPLPLKSMPASRLKRAARRGDLIMAGYHGDRFREGLLESPNCRFRSMEIPAHLRKYLRHEVSLGYRTMLHSCDSAKGSSGSPIIVRTKDGFQVVAINVGTSGWRRWKKRRNGRKRIIGRWKENIAVLAGPLIKLVNKLQTDDILLGQQNIKRLQTQLNRAGLNAGPVDGKLGRRTRQAIKKFEKRAGMAVTGYATRKLLAALEAKNAGR